MPRNPPRDKEIRNRARGTSLALGRQDYRLTEIHHLGGHIIGIDIRRDTYPQQRAGSMRRSSPRRRAGPCWPPSRHDKAPSPHEASATDQGYRFSQRLAGQLLDRAQQILTA